MGYSCMCFTAILSCLSLIVVQSFCDLIVLRHPLWRIGWRLPPKLTCYSEDDGSALVWNYDNRAVTANSEANISDFEPKKSGPRTNTECAIWKSTDCVANWESSFWWKLVNSAKNPTGPVLDYRWEGFEEIVFRETEGKLKYLELGEMEEYSGTIVFSVRALRDFDVFLCHEKDVTKGRCFWIRFGCSGGKCSKILSCDGGVLKSDDSSEDRNCTDIQNAWRETTIVDGYEWRTFRIEWKSEEQTIKLFNETEVDPFLQGTVKQWHSVSHIFIRSEISSRVRFHFYDYHLTQKKNTELSTTQFLPESQNFCVELLVGLCPNCQLKVNLVDENGQHIVGNNISGDKNSADNVPLSWKPIYLNATLKSPMPKILRLKIESILNDDKGNGQWAVDSFRLCKSPGSLRKSTITAHQGEVPSGSWPRVTCQKLSYTKGAVVNSLSTSTIDDDTSELLMLVRNLVKPDSNTSLGAEWSICNPSGCACDRGFTKNDCERECTPGFYGYNCNEQCGLCFPGYCDRAYGQCPLGCGSDMLLPPFCKEVERPIVEDITDTTARILQKVRPELLKYISNIRLNVTGGNGRDSPITTLSTVGSTYTINIKELYPGTTYRVHTFVTTKFRGRLTETRSRDVIFVTSTQLCFKVEPTSSDIVVILHQDLEGCEFTGPFYAEIRRTSTGPFDDSFVFPNFPYTFEKLEPYTEYKPTIYQGDTKVILWTSKVRTLQSAPGEPLNLTATHKGHGDVIFTWMHPSFSSSKITRFEITIDILHSVLLEKLKTRYPVTVDHTITKNQKYYTHMVTLQPSTNYTASVVAVNRRNQTSGAIKTELSVPTSVGFANETKPQGTFDGTSIDVIIPKIVNTTRNTTIKVIVKGLSTCTPIHPQESSPSANQAKSVMEWDAAVYQVGNETPGSMKIYTEQNHGVTSICSLDLEGAYTIVFNVTDWYSGISILTTISPITQKSSLAWLAILAPVLAVCVLVVFVWHRNRKIVSKRLREPSYVEPIPASLTTTTTVRYTLPPTDQTTRVLKSSIPRLQSYLEIIPPSSATTLTNNSIALDTINISSHLESAKNRSSNHLYTLPNEPDSSCSMSIKDFDEYAKNAASSKLLYSQFMRLQVGLTSPCEYGRLPENMPKNRSPNLIAYDKTRVLLEKIRGDLHSDYINASYIKGYRGERAYIGTQGPMPNTVNDFWRMIWEQKVRVICMLTNVTEGTETKCEKYWPDVGARIKHGDFLISNIDEQVFADYTFRTFELNFEQETRRVTHLHYTGWPSLGVPKNPQSLVAYLRKLEQTPTGNSPILVHCSTGDDRTGTVILCDICLRRAVAEKVIDVMAVALRMRDSRANMVGTLQQYVLAHIIMTESSVSRPTQIPCTDVLSSRMNELRIRLPSDLQRLKDTAWQQQVLRSSALAEPPISEHLTDGSPEKIYDDVFEEERNQINAVSVDGVKVNKQNFACWLPSPLTLPDFWEFVVERDIKLIIILQCSDPKNPSCYDIIPDESIVLPTLRIEMKNRTSLDNGEYFTTEKLLITDTSEENKRSQTVTVLTCRGWGCGMVQKPPDPLTLISLWRVSERIPRKEGQSLVLCHDGITGCGLYLALSFLLERMTVEGECDVIAAIRAVRRSKREYVQSMEQIEYLYDAAVNYVESFQAYANFR